MFGDLSQLRKFDISATLPKTGTEITFECKRDRLAHKTGNVAVEHKALLHSEAEFIVYMIDGDPNLYQIGRQALTTLLKENWAAHGPWPVVRGGEFQDWMTLIPVQEFTAFCAPI